MTPETLGRYEIVGELGKGAMGVVYLARDPIIHRQLAIKTFRMAYSAKEKEVQQFRERFLREAQAIGRLSHPNIVTVHDVGQEDDEYFIAMEYIKGINLKQRMQSTDEPLPLDFVVDVTAQIAEGLACAHGEGIVHRDIKPANIIITQSRRVKITDFGIARIEQSNLTQAGQLLGTPNYMAPEQIQGKAVDPRTDIFSLGVLLYEMLTRKKPFAGENLTQVSHRIVYDEFTSPEEIIQGLPPHLISVLDRALKKNPDKRYQEAAEMARDLRLLQEPISGAVPAAAAEEAAAKEAGPPAPPSAAGPPPAPVVESSPPARPASVPSVSPSSPAPSSPAPSSPAPSSQPSPPRSAAASPPAPVAAPPDSGQPSERPAPAAGVGARPAVPAASETSPAEPVKPGPTASTAPPPSAAPLPEAPSKPAAGPRTAAIFSRIPARSRMAVAALVAAGLVGLLILTRVLGGTDSDADTLESSRLERVRLEEQRMLRRAQEPVPGMALEQALDQLLIGIRKVPTSVELTRAYFELAARADREHDILEDYVRERMAYADAFISAQQYEAAFDVLEMILFVNPDNRAAVAKAEDIERFMNRRRRDERVADRQADTRPAPVRSRPAPPPIAPPPPASPVDLAISFRTFIAEGQVTVFADEAPIWKKSFDFDNRKLFKRKYLKGVRGFDEAYALSPGTVELRVRVEVDTKDGPRSLEGDLVRSRLSEGARPTLKIEVSEDATLKTTWIP